MTRDSHRLYLKVELVYHLSFLETSLKDSVYKTHTKIQTKDPLDLALKVTPYPFQELSRKFKAIMGFLLSCVSSLSSSLNP